MLRPLKESRLAAGAFSRLSVILAVRVFVIAACLVLISLDIWRSWNAFQVQMRAGQTGASNLARSIAQHAEDAYTEADTVLVSVVERLEVEGTGPQHLDRLRTLLQTHVRELPQLHGLFVYDAEGRWLVNSRQVLPDKVNNSDRDYFIHHRNNTDRDPYIGPPIVSRSTGEWILTITRRFNRSDGSFGGVVLATIYMDYFVRAYQTFDIGKSGTIILVHDRGKLLVRRPFFDEHVGKDMKDAPLIRDHLPREPHGTYMNNRSIIDGVVRMTSYRRVERYPLVAAVALPKEEVLASWWSNAWQSFLGVAILAALLGLMGFRLTRHIALHLDAEQKLRQAQENLQVLNRHLERIALQDGLTGLANRRQFDTTLLNEFNRAMRNGKPLALAMIDIDLFKQYNDVFGHPAGDECLKRIALAVQDCQKRPGDLMARYGGEEFAALLPDTDLEGARAVVENIRNAISGLAIDNPDSPNGIITVSCGIAAIVPEKDVSIPMDLLMAADKALYRAKSLGRDQIVCAPNVNFA